jgi:signal transduction histidine kinase
MEIAEKERTITELLTDTPRVERKDVSEIVDGVARTVRTEFPEASVTVECPERVTASVSERFGTAVEELAINAVTHNDSTPPRVILTVAREDDTVQVDVCDDGPVISAAERDVLLGTGDKSPTYHGSGLGLWLVNLIVSRSGGTITHEQIEPRGNVVGITLQP